MAFWVRYIALVLLCVAGPLSIAFWVDSQSELERAKRAGEAAAAAAPPALQSQLTLTAHELVARTLSLSNAIGEDRGMPPNKQPIRPETLRKLTDLLAKSVESGWLAWAIDESGAIIARNGQANIDPDPERITGHPLFLASQLGYSQDSLLVRDGKPFFVAIAPIVRDSEPRGAVLIGREIDTDFVNDLAGRVGGADLTLMTKDQVVASTLPSAIAARVAGAMKADEATSKPVLGGSRTLPLKRGTVLPFLPLFVAPNADGLAYASVQRPFASSSDTRWVISIQSTKDLDSLAERQQNNLGLLAVAVLLSIVFGLTFYRSFVRPLGLVTDHLADVTQGRGERELSDRLVAGPYKRLVKLVNMMVQRTPSNTFGFDGGSSLERHDDGSGDIGMAMIPSLPPGPPSMRPRSDPPPSVPPQEASVPPPPPPRPQSARATQDAMVGRQQSMEPPPMSALASLDPPSSPGFDLDSSRPGSAANKANRARMASEIRGTPSNSLVDFNAAALFPQGPPQTNAPIMQTPKPAPKEDFKTPAPIPLPDRAASQRAKNPPLPAAQPPSVAPKEVDELFSSIGLASERPASARGASPEPFGGMSGIPSAQTSSRMGGSAALGLGAAAGLRDEDDEHSDDFKSEATVVAAPNDDLLRASARDQTGHFSAHVPTNDTKAGPGEDADDIAHFRETYERFVEMRKACGEPTADLAFDRFVTKLRKNRDGLVQKYNCRTVRFQVYEKDGKAALKATPVRA
ncbi:MAG: MXAN_5187 C-terminal domain-containing protein [Myxococcota bacterium]